jgi:hypothetical protein
MAAYQQAKYYPPLIQVNAMRAKYPQFKAKHDKNGDIVFMGELQVKPELPVYTVKIIYRGDRNPRIYILRRTFMMILNRFVYTTRRILSGRAVN